MEAAGRRGRFGLLTAVAIRRDGVDCHLARLYSHNWRETLAIAGDSRTPHS